MLGLSLTPLAAEAAQAPNPTEVYEWLRTNLPGLTDAQLQIAAVERLVNKPAPRVFDGVMGLNFYTANLLAIRLVTLRNFGLNARLDWGRS